MKKLIILSLMTIVTVAFLVGFIDVVNQDTPNSKEVFTYSVSEIPTNLIMVGNLDKRAQDIICATSKGLVELDKDENINPSLSDSVDVRDEGLEYVFKIKDDVYWSDGNKITPKDIMAFFREILTEEKEENITAILNVYGARTFREGTGSFSENVGISISEDSITFRLNSKDDNFIKELTKPQYRLRKNILLWDKLDKTYDKLIYSGYYSIEEFNSSDITLVRNKKADSKLLENIKIVTGEEEEVAMAAFEIGGRDIVINPPKSQLNRLKSENRLITIESNEGIYLNFNPNNEILTIEDKKSIYGLINKSIEEYQIENNIFMELAEGSYRRTDKENILKMQARKVISNQYKEESKLKEVVLVAEEGSVNKEVCEYISNWFKKNTEIYLEYKLISKEEIDGLDNSNYYTIALIKGDLNNLEDTEAYSRFYKLLSKSQQEELDKSLIEDEKERAFSIIEEEIFNNYRILPLVFYNDNIAIKKEIKNIDFDGHENIDFSKISL